MTTATIQPAAWRVSMGATADHNYWHYFGKKPKSIDDGEIWEPLYSASTLESLQRENERLGADVKREAELATHMANDCNDAQARAEAAEAGVNRLREALGAVLAAHDIKSVKGKLLEDVIASATERARTALASTGGEHHAE